MGKVYEEFENAEQVWFWFCRCVVLREGLRSRSDYPGKLRPCEVGDIHLIIKKMRQKHHITNRHLRIMSYWGQLQVSPYYDSRAKRSEVRLWEEGLRNFEIYLKIQKILGG